jgi:MYXO-CTERM domain-containing protein
MTVLSSGRVLVAGGRTAAGITATSHVYDPIANAWSATASMTTARSAHAAVLLRDGRVLVMGGGGNGLGAQAGLASAEILDPVAGTWSPAGTLATSRYYFSATRLRDGRVLVTGGVHPEVIGGSTVYTTVAGAELYDPSSNAWSQAEPLATARHDHVATLLEDGRVLVTGGHGADYLRSTEIFDASTGHWSAGPDLSAGRDLATLTRLDDNTVVIAGGSNSAGAVASAERYDPLANTWTTIGALATARFGHTAALLPTGELVVAGGFGSTLPTTIELLDPATALWSPGGTLGAGRAYLQCAVQPDGRVLVGPGWQGAATYVANADLLDFSSPVWTAGPALQGSRRDAAAALSYWGRLVVVGGLDETGATRSDVEVFPAGPYGGATETIDLPSPRASLALADVRDDHVLAIGGHDGIQPLRDVDLIDLRSSSVTSLPPLAMARAAPTATLLVDGSVLVVGGRGADGLPVADAERLDPARAGWSTAGLPTSPRLGHSATRLLDGKVLVAGGGAAAGEELYDPLTNGWSAPGHQTGEARTFHTATLLLDGRVLLAGGLDADGLPLASAVAWDPAGAVESLPPMADARARHRALLLPSGRVLVVGGNGGSSPLDSAEEFDPATSSWRSLPPMAAARESFTLTLLANGDALAAGGADGLLSTDHYSPGRQGPSSHYPFLANWYIQMKVGTTTRLTIGGILGAPASGAGTPGSSNGDHPQLLLMANDGDGAALAPLTRWSDWALDEAVVPAAGTGLVRIFPILAGYLGESGPAILGPPIGQPCTGSADCAGAHCVDGVCCNTACGGGVSDCQACAAALGAVADGTCSPVRAGSVCRASQGACDPAEACDGRALDCPEDARSPSGTTCRTAAAACDAVETCDGSSPACPADLLLVPGTECRAAAGTCDLAEECDGVAALCPADQRRPTGTTCRVAAGSCDPEERCDGLDAACPTDLHADDGVSCGPAATCWQGACVDTGPVDGPAGCGCSPGSTAGWALVPAALSLLPARRRRPGSPTPPP